MYKRQIQDSGYKLQYVASVLHISSNTLRHKLLGETQFKLDAVSYTHLEVYKRQQYSI